MAGVQGRNRFKLYQQLLAFAFALVQGAGQLLYLKSYVPDFDIQWFVISLSILAGGAMLLVKVSPGLPQTGGWLTIRQPAACRLGRAARSLYSISLIAPGTSLRACIICLPLDLTLDHDPDMRTSLVCSRKDFH